MQSIRVRPAGAGDAGFLTVILLAAINWDPTRPAFDEAAMMNRREFVHYVEGWPKSGDLGVVAESDGSCVGAAWLRFFTADDAGYGFVAPSVPELTIGVVPDHRGRGIGGALLDAILAAARDSGIERISLSVEFANRAIGLYRGRGFREVGSADGAATMIVDLAGRRLG